MTSAATTRRKPTLVRVPNAASITHRQLAQRKREVEARQDELTDHPCLKIYAEPTSFRCRITAPVAKRILENQPRNRLTRRAAIVRYGDSLKEGRWQLNGETIKMDRAGHLLDGQHRLAAVFETDMALDTFVIAGLDDKVFETIDTGVHRGPHTILQVLGFKYPLETSAALRLLWQYQNGKLGTRLYPEGQDVVRLLRDNPSISDSIVYVGKVRPTLRASVGGFCHFIFKQKSESMANEFFDRLKDGLHMETSAHPIYVLREELRSQAGQRIYKRQPDIIYLTIQAWNFFRENKQAPNGLAKYVHNKAGMLPEFPEAL